MTEPQPSTPPSSSAATAAPRRRGLVLGAGAAAALAGAGLATWRLSLQPAQPGAQEALWSASFEGVNGGQPVQMAELRGKPLLLNFWATWCPPCVKELPLLDAFHAQQQSRGWQVLGLAIDQPANVEKFLQRVPLRMPLALAGLGGADLSRALGNERGGLPFTVLFAADGSILKRKMGELSESDLAGWARLA